MIKLSERGGEKAVRVPIEIKTEDMQELQALIQELLEAQSAEREIKGSKKARVPETGEAPLRTQAFETRGGIFGGETGKEEKFRDKDSKAAFQRQKWAEGIEKQVEGMEESQGNMMNSLMNLGFIGGVGATSMSGTTSQKAAVAVNATKTTAKTGGLGLIGLAGGGLGGIKGLMAKGGIYGMIAVAVLEVGQQILQMMLAPGGLWDRRFKRDVSNEQVKFSDLRVKEEISQGRRIVRVTTSSGLRGVTDQVRSNLDWYANGKRIFDLDGTLMTQNTGVGDV